MSEAAAESDAFSDPDGGARGRSGGGPADPDTVVAYGFWIFLLSDIIMFSALFAAYAVLRDRTAGGPAGKQLFDLGHVAIETGCLLLSSFTCGLMSLALEGKRVTLAYLSGAVTFALGAVFLGLEISEFAGMFAHGDGPQRSAFLSAFFTLVGMHGFHVTCGLIWLAVMGVQIATRGLDERVERRLRCFALFWHALDIVWVALFTVVYLIGVL
jgi:cytochrome o ubiquinol oxidase subunit 3